MTKHQMQSRPRALVLALGLLVGVACSDEAVRTMPTGPVVSVAPNAAPVESGAINDAIARIIPSLSDEKGAALLLNAFEDLLAAMSGNDQRSMSGQLTRARATLDSYTDAGGEAADLDALNLALESIATSLRAAG